MWLGGQEMGLHIECKFGSKKRGGFRVPVHFLAEANEEELNPLFSLEREYALPGTILAGTSSVEKSTIKVNYCKSSTKLVVRVNNFESFKISTTQLLPSCAHYSGCAGCQVCLPWRPGTHPDYSDFEQVFQKIASDIKEMYEKAVSDALASPEISEYQVALFDSSQETVLSQKFQEDVRSRPQRKLKL